jgi:hypothetical protein
MASGIAMVRATDTLLNDFTAASNYLSNFVTANKSLLSHRNVSSVSAGPAVGRS